MSAARPAHASVASAHSQSTAAVAGLCVAAWPSPAPARDAPSAPPRPETSVSASRFLFANVTVAPYRRARASRASRASRVDGSIASDRRPPRGAQWQPTATAVSQDSAFAFFRGAVPQSQEHSGRDEHRANITCNVAFSASSPVVPTSRDYAVRTTET